MHSPFGSNHRASSRLQAAVLPRATAQLPPPAAPSRQRREQDWPPGAERRGKATRPPTERGRNRTTRGGGCGRARLPTPPRERTGTGASRNKTQSHREWEGRGDTAPGRTHTRCNTGSETLTFISKHALTERALPADAFLPKQDDICVSRAARRPGGQRGEAAPRAAFLRSPPVPGK